MRSLFAVCQSTTDADSKKNPQLFLVSYSPYSSPLNTSFSLHYIREAALAFFAICTRNSTAPIYVQRARTYSQQKAGNPHFISPEWEKDYSEMSLRASPLPPSRHRKKTIAPGPFQEQACLYAHQLSTNLHRWGNYFFVIQGARLSRTPSLSGTLDASLRPGGGLQTWWGGTGIQTPDLLHASQE